MAKGIHVVNKYNNCGERYSSGYLSAYCTDYDLCAPGIIVGDPCPVFVAWSLCGVAFKRDHAIQNSLCRGEICMKMFRFTNDVLGINRRNRDYVSTIGGGLRQQVDDKLMCKSILRQHQFPCVPTLLAIRNRRQLEQLFKVIAEHRSIAIKPAQGSGGSGLMLIFSPDGVNYTNKKGESVARQDIIFHILCILNGDYSGGCVSDVAVVEPIIKDDECIGRIHEDAGLSDIRILLYKGIMQMAMLRLPCKSSHGAANLHAGGIGCGIDLGSGHCSYAIRYDKPILFHPDTGYRLANIKTPYWGKISTMMDRINDVFKMPYLGIDLVIDENLGPLLLEVNARPGLAVQIANRSGLRRGLTQVDSK